MDKIEVRALQASIVVADNKPAKKVTFMFKEGHVIGFVIVSLASSSSLAIASEIAVAPRPAELLTSLTDSQRAGIKVIYDGLDELERPLYNRMSQLMGPILLHNATNESQDEVDKLRIQILEIDQQTDKQVKAKLGDEQMGEWLTKRALNALKFRGNWCCTGPREPRYPGLDDMKQIPMSAAQRKEVSELYQQSEDLERSLRQQLLNLQKLKILGSDLLNGAPMSQAHTNKMAELEAKMKDIEKQLSQLREENWGRVRPKLSPKQLAAFGPYFCVSKVEQP